MVRSVRNSVRDFVSHVCVFFLRVLLVVLYKYIVVVVVVVSSH